MVTEINWDHGYFSNELWYQCEQYNHSFCVAPNIHVTFDWTILKKHNAANIKGYKGCELIQLRFWLVQTKLLLPIKKQKPFYLFIYLFIQSCTNYTNLSNNHHMFFSHNTCCILKLINFLLQFSDPTSSSQSCLCKPLSFLSSVMHGCPLHP